MWLSLHWEVLRCNFVCFHGLLSSGTLRVNWQAVMSFFARHSMSSWISVSTILSHFPDPTRHPSSAAHSPPLATSWVQSQSLPMLGQCGNMSASVCLYNMLVHPSCLRAMGHCENSFLCGCLRSLLLEDKALHRSSGRRLWWVTTSARCCCGCGCDTLSSTFSLHIDLFPSPCNITSEQKVIYT